MTKLNPLIATQLIAILFYVVSTQPTMAGELDPPAATIAPTMASLQQIYDQQRFAAFAGGNIKAGPGLITSPSPDSSGMFLGKFPSRHCTHHATSGISCTYPNNVLTVQSIGGCDVRITINSVFNNLVTTEHTIFISAGQSYASSDSMYTLEQASQAFASYTFLGGTDCGFMWVVR